MNTPTPTPRSKIILDHIKIYVEADNAAQSYAHYKEVNREIESMERELTAVTEQRDRLAEALELFLNRVQYTSAYMDGELRGGTFDYRSSGFDAEVKQAYQTIAAVKGDNHES